MNHLDKTDAVVRAERAEVLTGPSITLYAETEAIATTHSFLPAGSPGIPPHFHAEATEVFFLLEGTLETLVDTELVVLRPGDVLTVAPRTVHALAPVDGPAKLLVATTPSRERFEYYRLLDRVYRGLAESRELTTGQERFDSFFVDSPVWDARS